MKPLFAVLIITLILAACNPNSLTNTDEKTTAKVNPENFLDKTKEAQTVLAKKRNTFKNIQEIVADGSYSTWVQKQDDNFSLALHFQYKDTLAISYSPECWLIYPYKFEGNKIIVYWADYIDTKYDFDIVKIVKAINKTDKNYIGMPFMILNVENDTTLVATYPMRELIKKINSSSKTRTFFPRKFSLVQDGELYD